MCQRRAAKRHQQTQLQQLLSPAISHSKAADSLQTPNHHWPANDFLHSVHRELERKEDLKKEKEKLTRELLETVSQGFIGDIYAVARVSNPTPSDFRQLGEHYNLCLCLFAHEWLSFQEGLPQGTGAYWNGVFKKPSELLRYCMATHAAQGLNCRRRPPNYYWRSQYYELLYYDLSLRFLRKAVQSIPPSMDCVDASLLLCFYVVSILLRVELLV